MKVSYYPGCTLKTRAKNLEVSALAALKALDIEVDELQRWNCCGAVYSLADDDLIHIVAPVRDLIRVKQAGHDTVMTLCSMCYNTLARANELMKHDQEKAKTINDFMDEEPDYTGDVNVVHLLDYLRDEMGWDALKAKVTNPLNGLKVAPYYGCTLLRPKDVAIDNPDNPTVLHQFLEAIGCEVVDFPEASVCCGTYQILGNPEAALSLSHGILSSAAKRGAEALALACPLCDYNLGKKQDVMLAQHADMTEVPVYYFSQLLALALGVGGDDLQLQLNRQSSTELLKGKNLLGA